MYVYMFACVCVCMDKGMDVFVCINGCYIYIFICIMYYLMCLYCIH